MVWLMFVSFFIFLAMGVPIAFVLILSTLVYIFFTGGDVSCLLVPQRIMRGVNSFLLICLPLFILAGNIMNQGGITERLVRFAQVFVGHIRGGLAMVNVLVCILFGGVSGSAVAGTSAVGSIMIPAMKKEGYDVDFAAGLTAVASTCCPIIPPSLAFVIYGAMAKVSIGDMFLAGYIPGIMMGFFMMCVVYIYASKRKYPKMIRPTLKEFIAAVLQGLPCVFLPVLIVIGLISGWFTPTEAAAFACVYALFLSAFVYRSITWKNLWNALVDSAVDSGSIMLIVGACYLFGWVIANERISVRFTDFLLGLDVPLWVKLLYINLALLVVGMFMDSAPAILLVTPILAPAMVVGMGLDPIHAGMIICLNLVIGLSTPPVGVCLYAAANIGRVSFEQTIKASIPFTLASIAGLMLVTYIPFLTEIPFKIFGF